LSSGRTQALNVPLDVDIRCRYPGYDPVTRDGKTYPGGNRDYRHNDGAVVTFC
jgi:hypothetical protein